ncbi:MAG: DNA-binding response regulator [Bacteroidetes bacterium]|nr:MAG: DNA-binding response regulator [Bacteroidota bacterium]PTM13513.1 MAG: DNA-binding response regulator [Bacteroidota bacterium]
MTCLIIDDNPLARLALRNMTSEIEGLHLAGECESAMQAYNFLKAQPCDLLLLDVEMPGMSGLELLKSLEKHPLIILVTSKTAYAVDGFEMQVVDYLVKPVTMPRLLKAVNLAMERHKDQYPANHFFARVDSLLVRIDFQHILFVHALGDYVVFQTEDKKYPVHLTMKAVEERLPSNHFMRVHRSYIVALDKIVNLEQNSLLIGSHAVPVSEKVKGKLMQRLNIF